MDDRSVCEYILERIREYIDEYSDTDVNGYHNSKWCAMKERRLWFSNISFSASPRMSGQGMR